MFAGEAEIQAKRRTLAVLIDEMRRVSDAARDLGVSFQSLISGEREDLLICLERVKKAEEDVESFRRMLARELAELGSLIMNREDLLRAAYLIEDLAGYVNGIVFRLTQISGKPLQKQGLEKDFRELTDLIIDILLKLNETVRSLSLTPNQTLELANTVQKLEKVSDDKYRQTITKLLSSDLSIKEILLLKDVADILEETGDKALEAADTVTILALGF
jgi:uncharacterized protein Yka (UPF0111/DUF47 family)